MPELVAACGISCAFIRATRNRIRLPPLLFRPIAADEVAPVVAEAAPAAPRNGAAEIAVRCLKAIGALYGLTVTHLEGVDVDRLPFIRR